MRGLPAGVVLLLVVLPTWASAQTTHEDFATASADDTGLHAWGRSIVDHTTLALNESLDDRESSAASALGEAANLSQHMGQALAPNGTAATSSTLLRPLVASSQDLVASVDGLLQDWARITALNRTGGTFPADAALLRLHLASARSRVAEGLRAADAFAAQGYDVGDLRAGLEGMRNRLDAFVPPPLLGDGLVLEADPATLPFGHALTLRGLLGAASPGGVPVWLQIDNASWANVTTGPDGYFEIARLAGGLAVGPHVAGARATLGNATLRSNDVPIDITRLAVNLRLTPSFLQVGPNATVALDVTLQDEDNLPLSLPVATRVDGTPREGFLGPAARLTYNATLLGLGEHVVEADFPGDATHLPAQAQARIVVATAPPSTPPASALWNPASWDPRGLLLVGGLVLLLATGLGLARRRRARGYALVALAGLVLEGGATFLLLRSVGWTLLALLLGGVCALLLVPREAATSPEPSARRDPAGPPEPGPPIAAELVVGPYSDAIRQYRSLLRRLAQEGVDVGPLTHREVAHALLARGHPESLVRDATERIERILYATNRATDPDAAHLRNALDQLGASS